jgi:hypothetical protein
LNGLEKNTVCSIDWYDDHLGHSDSGNLSLTVAYENGRILLFKDARDDSKFSYMYFQMKISKKPPFIDPFKIESGLSDLRHAWNHNGTVLAVYGNRTLAEDSKSFPVINFYNNQGLFLRSLRLSATQGPASSAANTCIAWDYTGSRFVVALDSYLYFANVYQEYKWCYALDSIVFAYEKQGEEKSTVCFWNILTQEKIIK